MKKAILVCCVGVAACSRPVPKIEPAVHYVVGAAWQVDGFWVYPREDFSYQATGLAVRVDKGKKDQPLTTDGEVRSDLTMTASHPTLQLPAIVTVTNLDNGRVVKVRLNDRGPDKPGRVLGVTPKVASLLGITDQPAKVRVVEDEQASRHLAEILPGGPALQINAAPLEGVVQTQLAGGQSAGRATKEVPSVKEGGVAQTAGLQADVAAAMADLPVSWWQGAPSYARLWVETTDFTSRYAAAREAAREGGSVVPSFASQGKMWAVRHGPFATISEADTALRRSLADGLTGSHIVVE